MEITKEIIAEKIKKSRCVNLKRKILLGAVVYDFIDYNANKFSMVFYTDGRIPFMGSVSCDFLGTNVYYSSKTKDYLYLKNICDNRYKQVRDNNLQLFKEL